MKIFKILLRIILTGLIIGVTYITVSYHTPGNLTSSSYMDDEMEILTNLRSKVNDQNTKVSSAPVGWHLDHLLLTINSVYETLKKSDTLDYNPGFNMPRIVMFSLDFIPRGRAKSPEKVRPKDNVTLAIIEDHLQTALVNLKRFDSLPKNSNFIHPYIGQLNRESAKRFLKIHMQHHLKICNDIIKEE